MHEQANQAEQGQMKALELEHQTNRGQILTMDKDHQQIQPCCSYHQVRHVSKSLPIALDPKPQQPHPKHTKPGREDPGL